MQLTSHAIRRIEERGLAPERVMADGPLRQAAAVSGPEVRKIQNAL